MEHLEEKTEDLKGRVKKKTMRGEEDEVGRRREGGGITQFQGCIVKSSVKMI